MKATTGKLIEADLTGLVIGSFYAVYNALGFGFLESVCVCALMLEFDRRGLKARREVPVRVYYEGRNVALFRVDLLIEDRLVVEVKASKTLVEADHKQLYNYLRSTDLQVGLLLHFGPTPSFCQGHTTRKKHQSAPLPLDPRDPR